MSSSSVGGWLTSEVMPNVVRCLTAASRCSAVHAEADAPGLGPRLVHAGQPVEAGDGGGGPRHDRRPRQLPQLRQRPRLHRLAVPDDGDPVGQHLDLGQDVTGQQHGAPGGLHLGDDLLEHRLHQRVETARRLVQDEQLDVRGQGGDEGDLLPVALGVGARLLLRVELEPLDQLVLAPLVDPAAQTPEHVDDLTSGEARPQLDITGYVRQPPVQRDRLGPGIAAQQPDGAGGGAHQAQQDPDGGGFSGAVGAEEAVHFAGVHGEVEAVERAGGAERLDES